MAVELDRRALQYMQGAHTKGGQAPLVCPTASLSPVLFLDVLIFQTHTTAVLIITGADRD